MPDEVSTGDARQALRAIDKRLAELWQMGSWFVAGWSLEATDLIVALAPIGLLPELAKSEIGLLRGDALDGRGLIAVAKRADLRIEAIPAGTWWTAPAMRAALAQSVQRYAIRRSPFHAAARIEIANFASLETVEQVVQLATLSYSLNLAAERLVAANSDIDLGRSATAAGYRLWNRRQGWKADTDLFCLLALALAENGLARARDPRTAPVVKAAFAVGPGWEFSLPRGGGSPMIHNDLLGEVRSTVSTLVECALPGQILTGTFDRPMVDGAPRPGVIYKNLDAPRFMGLAQRRLGDFDNVLLGPEKIAGLKLYLTGEEIGRGTFDVSAFGYALPDGADIEAFNVKLNIFRPANPPLFFGLQQKDLVDVARRRAYHSDDSAREFVLKD
jgi:hypothetical protein